MVIREDASILSPRVLSSILSVFQIIQSDGEVENFPSQVRVIGYTRYNNLYMRGWPYSKLLYSCRYCRVLSDATYRVCYYANLTQFSTFLRLDGAKFFEWTFISVPRDPAGLIYFAPSSNPCTLWASFFIIKSIHGNACRKRRIFFLIYNNFESLYRNEDFVFLSY